MYNINYNNAESRVSKVLFENPTRKFYIRELARLTNLNPNTILNITRKLQLQNLIKINKKQHIKEIVSDIENPDFTKLKRIFNLFSIVNSGLVDFLIKEYSPKAISLIGSYSKGEDIEKSDIDLVVISNREKAIDLSKFEKVLSRKIQLIVTGYKKMSEEFYINLIKGIVLYGYINKNETI